MLILAVTKAQGFLHLFSYCQHVQGWATYFISSNHIDAFKGAHLHTAIPCSNTLHARPVVLLLFLRSIKHRASPCYKLAQVCYFLAIVVVKRSFLCFFFFFPLPDDADSAFSTSGSANKQGTHPVISTCINSAKAGVSVHCHEDLIWQSHCYLRIASSHRAPKLTTLTS